MITHPFQLPLKLPLREWGRWTEMRVGSRMKKQPSPHLNGSNICRERRQGTACPKRRFRATCLELGQHRRHGSKCVFISASSIFNLWVDPWSFEKLILWEVIYWELTSCKVDLISWVDLVWGNLSFILATLLLWCSWILCKTAGAGVSCSFNLVVILVAVVAGWEKP